MSETPNSIEHGIGFLVIKIPSANRRFLESNNGARKSHADLGHILKPRNNEDVSKYSLQRKMGWELQWELQYLSKGVVHFGLLFVNIGEWFLELPLSYFI